MPDILSVILEFVEFVLEKWSQMAKSPELKSRLGSIIRSRNMDTIADLLTQIRNALAVKKPLISVPHSNFKQNLAELLSRRGYLGKIEKTGRGVKKNIKIELNYDENGSPRIVEIKKISKPGQRIYSNTSGIKPVKSGLGHRIISTSSGLMFDFEARKKGLGGEVICEIF